MKKGDLADVVREEDDRKKIEKQKASISGFERDPDNVSGRQGV